MDEGETGAKSFKVSVDFDGGSNPFYLKGTRNCTTCCDGSHTVAARALATYLIAGCVRTGVRFVSESSSGGGAGGVWKSGNLEIWGPRNPEFGVQKIRKTKLSKFKPVLPNVGKVWISRNQILLAPSGAI